MGLFDTFRKKQKNERKKNISLVVSDKLPNQIYKTIENFKIIYFEDGEIEFFNKSNIDEAQKGFRYNPINNEIINDWIDDEYIIIGYDCSSGCGPDPIIVYNDKNYYPIYWLMTDGGDWNHPLKIADTFEEFVNAYKNIIKNKEKIENNSLNSKEYNELYNNIKKIINENNFDWWKNFLQNNIRNSKI